ncbi:hypothetical protein Pcar_3266 [Syntrophotalea carbinolica DSM 2380]|uniref:Uncharacterized protein n=1 Tax=Syntrophotalea carbinolica (strain DSM 2380 / NBRC 103641 / GraBd1) TaxID=338963 RepID=Q0C6Q1_SYNC1|nr:hypothetical protein Pcar_3266 [Syntrophotalea carbinolica DSM 2380]
MPDRIGMMSMANSYRFATLDVLVFAAAATDKTHRTSNSPPCFLFASSLNHQPTGFYR